MGIVSKQHIRHCVYLLTTKPYITVSKKINWSKIRKALEDFNDV